MKKLGLLLIIASMAGCDDDDDIIDGTGGDGTDGTDGTPPTTFEWRANLVSTDPYSALAGSALVRMVEGEQAFTASAEIRNDLPGSVRPWHVHVGSCGSGGAIVGQDGAYPRLTTGGDGFAAIDVIVRVGLDPAGTYHVNVHDSDLYFTTIIACGNLVRQ